MDISLNMDQVFSRLGGIKSVEGDVFRPVSEAEIVAIEDGLGVQFPDLYRDFLAKYGASAFNGESPDNPYVEFRPLNQLPAQFDGGNGLFNAFYGAMRDENDGYSLQVRIRFYSERIPEAIIPVGDSWGSQICLGIKGAYAGKMYFWDEQNEPLKEEDYLEEYGKPRPQDAIFQNVHLIANSFEDFLKRLEVAEAE